MGIQRLRLAATGHYIIGDNTGEFVHYESHKEVVDLIYDQLDITQKQLERAQEQIRQLTDALCDKPLPPRGR